MVDRGSTCCQMRYFHELLARPSTVRSCRAGARPVVRRPSRRRALVGASAYSRAASRDVVASRRDPVHRHWAVQVGASGPTSFDASSSSADKTETPTLSSFSESEMAPFKRRERQAVAARGQDGIGEAAALGLGEGRRGLEVSFDGISAIKNRLARDKTQFSGEPPDQGLCAGNGFVLESANQALRVHDRQGAALTPVIAQSAFYGYPPDIDRETGIYGAFTFDISCYFDPEARRWFHVALTLDQEPDTGLLTGANRLDIAVSRTADPRGLWNYYAIPTQNDGTEGTPDHRCGGGFCFADYPHIGADRHGFYISANSFPLFSDGFKGANLYALSKRDLVEGDRKPTIVQFERLKVPSGRPAYTVWPAQTHTGRFEEAGGGTEYLMSNVECTADTCVDDRLVVWAVPNSKALRSRAPTLSLLARAVHGKRYLTPPRAQQRPGPFPLGECINDTSIRTPLGPGCWRYFFDEEPEHTEQLPVLDSGPNGVGQVSFVAGRLWTTLSTAVMVAGERRAGTLYSVLVPELRESDSGPIINARVESQRRLGIPGHDVAYATVGVRAPGKELLSFSLSGEHTYPSAAYVRVTASGFEPVQVSASGRGPIEGFTGYRAFEGDAAIQRGSRYGDYGATAIDGDGAWVASEYAGQKCNLRQFVKGAEEDPPLTCGRTRTAISNWYTRVSFIRLP